MFFRFRADVGYATYTTVKGEQPTRLGTPGQTRLVNIGFALVTLSLICLVESLTIVPFSLGLWSLLAILPALGFVLHIWRRLERALASPAAAPLPAEVTGRRTWIGYLQVLLLFMAADFFHRALGDMADPTRRHWVALLPVAGLLLGGMILWRTVRRVVRT
jgi:hypothetical protein